MSVAVINSILLPPVLFILFVSLACSFFYPAGTMPVRAARPRKMVRQPRPGAMKKVTRPERAKPSNSAPQWAGLGDLLDEELSYES